MARKSATRSCRWQCSNRAIAILDETDSGLDIDALRIVADGVNRLLEQNGDKMGVLVITHYQRLLNYIKPQFVHVLARGRIIKDGGPELALELEEKGYGPMLAALGVELPAEETRRTRPCNCYLNPYLPLAIGRGGTQGVTQ